MSQVGSEVGGKVGGSTSVDQTQFPYFTSPGGVTPEQTSLAGYDYGQNLLEGQAQFGGGDEGGGNAMSTMATQVAGGANMGRAENLASMSDVNQGADLSAFNNAISINQQNNEAGLAENEQALTTSLGDLATAQSAAGTAAGLKSPLPGATS